MMAADAAVIAGGEIGEPVVYRAAGNPTNDITIEATVFRHPLGLYPGMNGGQSVAPLNVFIPAGQGIVSINTGGDVIVLSIRCGAVPQPVPVREISSQDPGGWNLLLY
jgi:hypothetical protein